MKSGHKYIAYTMNDEWFMMTGVGPSIGVVITETKIADDLHLRC